MASVMDIEDEIEQCRMGAARRVGEWLTVPQDLEKLPQLRATVASKKMATDAQLKAAVTGQLDSAREGMSLLSRSYNSILTVRNNFASIDKLCSDCQDLIGHYDLVTTVNDTRNNLHHTRSELEKTLAIPKKVKEVYELLEEDSNLLIVHAELKDLERLRDESLNRAQDNPQQCRLLDGIFEKVAPLREALDENLFRILALALPTAKERPAILVKAVQVVEREHKAQLQREAKAQTRTTSSRRKVRTRKRHELGDEDKPSRKQNQPDKKPEEDALEGEYRGRCMEAIQRGTAERFKVVYADVGDDIHRIIAQSKLLVADLHDVFAHAEVCFPPVYKISPFYIRAYHARLAAMFSQFSSQADDLATAEILDLIKWVQLEYEPQLAKWGISEVEPLMDSLVPLMLAYKEDMRVIMDTWCTRLLESDRKSEAEEIEGKYYTDAPVLLFKFVNQQIDVVQPTGCSKLIGVVLAECVQVLRRYQEAFLKMLQEEADDLFMEYMLATINNNTKCCDYTQELRFKLGTKVNPADLAGVDFNGCAEVFEKIAVAGIKVVVGIIFKDLEPALAQFFTKDWYTQDTMETIIATLKDYYENEEVKTRILEASFRKLAQECIERLVKRYVEEMVVKKQSFEARTTERMRKDEQLVREFCKTDTNLNESAYDTLLAVFPHLYNLVDADVDMISVHVGDLADHYPDLNIWVVETLLSKRPDLNKIQVKEAAEACARILEAKQEARGSPVVEPANPHASLSMGAAPQLSLFGSIKKHTGALSQLLGKQL